jgi:succinyl-CoA synthetase beta subunit
MKINIPIVVRLVGTNQEEGKRLLEASNFTSAETLAQAAQLAVDLAREKQL